MILLALLSVAPLLRCSVEGEPVIEEVTSSTTTASAESAPSTNEPGVPVKSGDFQPNIIMILLDDFGTDQLEMYDVLFGGLHDFSSNLDHTYAITPNLDELACKGLRFNWAFTSPTCSPTRAQLLTGRYPFRTGIGGIATPNGFNDQVDPARQQQLDLPLEERTLPELLGEAGYRTAIIGKWHLAREESFEFGVPSAFNSTVAPPIFPSGVPNIPGRAHPVLTGWSYFAGIMQNPQNSPGPNNSILPASICMPMGATPPVECPSRDYNGWIRVESIASPLSSRDDALWNAEIISSNTRGDAETFVTTVQRQDLVSWIATTPEPFFALWAATAPHGPFNAPPPAHINDHVGCSASGPTQGNPSASVPINNNWDRYQYLIQSIDTEIGILRNDLGPAGLDILDETLFIIMGDNGTPISAARAGSGTGPGLCGVGPQDRISPQEITFMNDPTDIRFKGSPYMTGTAVPLIFSGYGVASEDCMLPPNACALSSPTQGRVDSHSIVETVDVFQTILDLAGASAASGVEVDGSSFAPLLSCGQVVDQFEAFSLVFSPNGAFSCALEFDVGLTARVDTSDSTSPFFSDQGTEIFRLLWRTGDSLESMQPICSMPPMIEHLFRVSPGAGVLESTANDLVGPSGEPEVLALLRNRMLALFAEGHSPGCTTFQVCGATSCATCPSDDQL